MPQSHIQSVLHADHDQWTVTLSKDWDVLGPFPIHAREQQFLSPSFPIDLSQPVDWQKSWPSSYADGATVQWSKTQLSDDGVLKVSFPEIRWENLRQTEGWAALQHHAVLRGTVTLTPPRAACCSSPPARLLVQLNQGSYFTILPPNATERGGPSPEWHAGNIYKMERALPRAVALPTAPDSTRSTPYGFFISGEYEIRLFGDPQRQGSHIPTQIIGLSVEIEYTKETVQREPPQDVLCDFYDGFGFGNAIGVGLRSVGGWWTVTNVSSKHPQVQLRLKQSIRIAPSQLRVVPLVLSQSEPFYGNTLEAGVTVTLTSGQEHHLSVCLPITQHAAYSQERTVIQATYFFVDAMPTAFLAIPPMNELANSHPPILALHGAGVDILKQSFWSQSLPRNDLSWTILPTGRTSWGLDWHGPSALDAWRCVDALSEILSESSFWKPTAFSSGTPVVLIGHSNGGQGVWYLSSRFPDRVLAAVPAAGYIKSQAYVPLTMSRSAHFVDPVLRAILESSLTPDDNDLFLTNLLNTPILVIHGGNDDNVPVWHGREFINVAKTWSMVHRTTSNITLKEDKGKGHWYSTVFDNEQVREFIDDHLKLNDDPHLSRPLEPFTLTVFRPEESGPMRGWKIDEVKCPGRLARLTVTPSQSEDLLEIRTINIKRFSVLRARDSPSAVCIDGDSVSLDNFPDRSLTLHFEQSTSTNRWELVDREHISPSPPTRLQSFLSSKGLITFILPTTPTRQAMNYVSLGFRLAHDLHIYHRLDTELVYDHEIFGQHNSINWPKYNFAVVGSLQDVSIQHILRQNKTPLRLKDGRLILNGRPVRIHPGTGMVVSHPHPSSSDGLVLLVIGESPEALERSARLFPIRTGIPVPSWVILDSKMDTLGAAGISGAGVWGPAWAWNEALSWSEIL